MSGGISAIKGFDYQATVILDRLLDHFERHGGTAYVRPEGVGDLDLSWTENATEYRRHEQIKKEREDDKGNRTPEPWTLTDAINELFPNTIAHLLGNDYEQVWIVGDEIHNDLDNLVKAGRGAPSVAVTSYWTVVHRLARNHVIKKIEGSPRAKLQRWKVPDDLSPDPMDAVSRLLREFEEFLTNTSGDKEAARQYQEKVEELHGCLPGVLARIQIQSIYGSEEDVRKKVQDRLEQRYKLPRSVVEDTLFRNLRGFINDVSKRIGQTFGQVEFEVELRSVWPRMIPVREPPPLVPGHVRRSDLAESLTHRWSGRATEVIGISGSGKTSLAAEVIEKSREVDPDRKVFYAEVRPDVDLRDVLAGVGFHLRRSGFNGPFSISIEPGRSEEEVLARLARSYSSVPQQLLLLIDLVEGTCSDGFARDLATFIRDLSSVGFRLAVLGQESALRELNALERSTYHVSQVDIRGFNFQEFVTLVTYYTPFTPRAENPLVI